MKRIKQDHVINGLLPCFSEIISKRMVKNREVARQLNKQIAQGFAKFKEKIGSQLEEKPIVANFMNLLLTSNLLGDGNNDQQESFFIFFFIIIIII